MNCPTDDLLISFSAGTLEEVVREPIRAHLENCEDCAARVVWFQEELFQEFDDDLIDDTDDPTKSLAHQDSMNDAANPTVVFDSDDSFDTSLLEPSKDPGFLGRLGRYQVRRIIGTGAMGVVLEAFEEGLRRTVAIKLLRRQISTSELARRRFIREARAAAGIIHPNVVTIFGVEEQRNSPYLVMEYVSGGTLREYIREHKRLAPMEVVRLAKGIAEGLAAAHRQGVIHRDIKPGNLLLEEGALRAKITDFGLARAAVDQVDLTSHGLAVGTPAYMSPEQVTGGKLDFRTDLFSLGCVIYAMVAGRTPFRGTSQFAVARRIVEDEPTPLGQVVQETPRFLADLTQRLLAKHPEDRFSSATEVANLLEHYLARLNESPTDEISGIMRNVRLQPHLEATVERPSEIPVEIPVEVPVERPSEISPKRPQFASRRIFAVAPLVLIVAMLAVWPFLGRHKESPPPDSDKEIIEVGDLAKRPGCVGTIAEAVLRATPGVTVRIYPDKEYEETILIGETDRLAGITLAAASEATTRPVLKRAASNSDSAVITVRNVSGVTIRGLEIHPGGVPGIVIEGDCQNVLIERVHCAQPSSGGQPAIDVWARATGDNVGPITIRGSTIDSPGTGHCLRMGHPEGLHTVRLEGNRFQGRGVLVLAAGMLKNATICGNQFLRADTGALEDTGLPGMTVGLNLNIEFPSQVERIVVCNNTFLGMEHWLGIVHSVTSEQADVVFANNLILACGGVQGDPERLPGIADHWNFRSNWWETDESASNWNDLWMSLAETQPEIEVLNRTDREHADFLRPLPGSPLWSSGAGDGEFPGYVGAVKPDSNP